MKPTLLLILAFAAYGATAQSMVKTNIAGIKLRNNGAILHNNQVTGYYFFFNLEKTNAQLNNYALVVTDENLKEVSTVNIIRPSTFNILEASFNGVAFAVLGYDRRARSIEVISYDNSLRQIGATLRMIRNKNMNESYGSVVSGNESEQDFLVPAANKGFLLYSMAEDDLPHYRIELLNNELKTIWSDEARTGAVQIGMEGLQNRDYIASIIETRTRRNDKDIVYELLVNRTDNGERVFRKPVSTKGLTLAVADVKYDTITGQFVVFGEYYGAAQRESRDRSEGFMSMAFDSSGNIVRTTQNPWKQISERTPLNDKGKFEGANYNINVHNTVRTRDGQMFVIGELYKKAASAGGIALKTLAFALGGNSSTSTVKLEVADMIIMEFNPDFNINKVHLFDKSKSSFMLPEGALTVTPKWVAQYGRSVGAFDYKFTQVSSDQTGFIVNYVDYDKSGEQPNFVIGSIVYTPEKVFATDKFKATKRTQAFSIFKAKEGYIAVSEYFRKEKKLESRLEKINY